VDRKDDGVFEHYFVDRPKSKAEFGLIQTYLRGKAFEFLTASSVFSRRRIDFGSRLLIEKMILPDAGNVLDVGCGYGAVGIAAAALKPELYVVLTDVNQRAVNLAKQNAARNNVTNVEVRYGSLYEPVKELTFNCVLSNPPVSAGMKIVRSIITEAKEIMKNEAVFQMVVKSKIAGKRLTSIFTEVFGGFEVLGREKGYRVLLAKKQELS